MTVDECMDEIRAKVDRLMSATINVQLSAFIRLRVIPALEFVSYSPSKECAHGPLWRLRERRDEAELRARKVEAALYEILIDPRCEIPADLRALGNEVFR